MSGKVSKMGRWMARAGAAFRADCHFSLQLAFLRFLDDLSWRLHLAPAASFFHGKKEAWISHYLYRQLESVVRKYAADGDLGQPVENAPIWVCWWSGEESAPELVKQCIRSVRTNAGEHPVHFITSETVSDFLELPRSIFEKAENGKLGTAHLTDYIRVSLLARYGGLWLDATIFCTQPVSETFFELPACTCKSSWTESRYISHFQWVTFCLSGWQENVLFRFLQQAFQQYWSSHDLAIDYLFFDYLIDLAKKNIPAVAKELNAIPVNNLRRDDLQAAMNAALPAEAFSSVVRPDTALYKLSWRETYSLETADGRPSIYAHFLNL